jgi:hypothetical protein
MSTLGPNKRNRRPTQAAQEAAEQAPQKKSKTDPPPAAAPARRTAVAHPRAGQQRGNKIVVDGDGAPGPAAAAQLAVQPAAKVAAVKAGTVRKDGVHVKEGRSWTAEEENALVRLRFSEENLPYLRGPRGPTTASDCAKNMQKLASAFMDLGFAPVTAAQIQTKWENLLRKYKVCCAQCPSSGWWFDPGWVLIALFFF